MKYDSGSMYIEFPEISIHMIWRIPNMQTNGEGWKAANHNSFINV